MIPVFGSNPPLDDDRKAREEVLELARKFMQAVSDGPIKLNYSYIQDNQLFLASDQGRYVVFCPDEDKIGIKVAGQEEIIWGFRVDHLSEWKKAFTSWLNDVG
jgi:hypothetical protein